MPAERRATALVATVLIALAAREASAQSTTHEPGVRAGTPLELEPHMLLTPFDPPGFGTGDGIGLGFRGTFEIAPHGLLGTVNDSVGIGVGVDYLHYGGRGLVGSGACTRFVPGPNQTNVCVEVAEPGGPSNYFFFPVVMQWNFWFKEKWSAFVEPGLAVYLRDGKDVGVTPVVLVGGRFRFTNFAALTLRVGYPAFSIGLSLFP